MVSVTKMDQGVLTSVRGGLEISDKFNIIHIFQVCSNRMFLIFILLNRWGRIKYLTFHPLWHSECGNSIVGSREHRVIRCVLGIRIIVLFTTLLSCLLQTSRFQFSSLKAIINENYFIYEYTLFISLPKVYRN